MLIDCIYQKVEERFVRQTGSGGGGGGGWCVCAIQIVRGGDNEFSQQWHQPQLSSADSQHDCGDGRLSGGHTDCHHHLNAIHCR